MYRHRCGPYDPLLPSCRSWKPPSQADCKHFRSGGFDEIAGPTDFRQPPRRHPSTNERGMRDPQCPKGVNMTVLTTVALIWGFVIWIFVRGRFGPSKESWSRAIAFK